MKIVHLALGFLPTVGGAEVAVHNIAAHQAYAGHDVNVVTTFRSWLSMSGLPYKLWPFLPATNSLDQKLPEPLRGRWPAFQLRQIHRLLRPDVWHVHVIYPAAPHAARAFSSTSGKVPLVVTAQGEDIQLDPSIPYGARLDSKVDNQLRTALGRFDAAGAISSDVADQFESLGMSRSQIWQIPNGADTPRFAVQAEHKETTRKRHGVDAHKSVILTVARNHPKKGLDAIPAIAQRLAQCGIDFRWVLVGRGMQEVVSRIGPEDPTYGSLEAVDEVAPVGWRDGVLGPADELLSYYSMADVFVLPTRIEGLPLVCVEALAAGLPVVATSAPGCVDVVDHERNGLLSPVGDVGGMATNIASLLSDERKRSAFGKSALEDAQRYNWQSIADEYTGLYGEVRQGVQGQGL